VYKKTHSALQIGRREREREREREKKRKKQRNEKTKKLEIVFRTLGTHRARPPPSAPKLSPQKKNKKTREKKNSLSGALENSVRKFELKRSSSAT
jgi:hypothetical protein